MEIISKYWAQIALFVTIGFQALTAYFNFRAKNREQRFDVYLKNKINVVSEWHESYSAFIFLLHNLLLEVVYGKQKSADDLDLKLLPLMNKWTMLSTRLKMYSSDEELKLLNKAIASTDEASNFFTSVWGRVGGKLDIPSQNGLIFDFLKMRKGSDHAVNDFILLQRKNLHID